MATINPFDLLGDDDTGDLSQLIAVQQQKIEPKKAQAPSAKLAAAPKLPSKPLPPAQAVRAKTEQSRGSRGGGRGYGAGGGSYRDSSNNENSHGNKEIYAGRRASDEADTGKPFERRGGYGGTRGDFRGGRRGGFSNGDVRDGSGDRPHRPFERHSGTGRGNDIKREGAGRGNWGNQTDELAQVGDEAVTEGEKIQNLNAERPSEEGEGDAERPSEEREPEDKEMTLEEYEKVLEEKRKALQALKTEGRKIDVKEFESMQQLSNKKANDDIFVKLGSGKDKKKELAEKEERAKKSVSINEFLKPAEGGKYYSGGRGRGRGRGPRGGGGYLGGSETSSVRAPAIEDPGQFPTLGGK